MKRLNQSVVQHKHTGCSLSSTLCPSNLICVSVSVRGEVCVGVLILPHRGLGLSITSALQVCKEKMGMFHEVVRPSDTLCPYQLCFIKTFTKGGM